MLRGVLGMDVSGWTSAEIGDHGWWVQSIVITLIAISQALFNHFGIKTTTALTDFSGYLIFVVGRRPDARDVRLCAELGSLAALRRSSTTPANRAAMSCRRHAPPSSPIMIGLLYPIYTITGFDASAHTSEETIDARSTRCRGA